MPIKVNWDAWGITASIACAIHCAVLPLVASSLPLFGVNIIDNVWFEYTMIFIAFGIGVYSLYHGKKSHHHSNTPLIIFMLGILLLFAKQIWHTWQIFFLIPAVILVVTAHFLNYKKCRIHNHTHNNDCKH